MSLQGDNKIQGSRRVAGRKSLSISSTISRLKRSLGKTNSTEGEVGAPAPMALQDVQEQNNIQNDPDEFSSLSSDENIQNGAATHDNFIISDSNSAEVDSITNGVVGLGYDNGNTIVSSPVKTRYACNHCDYVSISYSGWNYHFKRLHPRLAQNAERRSRRHFTKLTTAPKKKVPTLYSCQYCNYITLSMQGFIIHSSRVHPKRKANPLKRGTPITTATNKKYLEALYLSKDETPKTKNKVQKLLAAYHRDSRVLEEIPKYLSTKCILCKQNFSTTGILGQHYEMSHSGQGPKKDVDTGLYHCKLCDHESLTRLALYKHYAKTHYMDAFYAWSVSSLESMLQEKHRHWSANGEISCVLFQDTTSTLTKLDNSLPSTLSWNAIESMNHHTASDNIPCVSCNFSTKNVIELLSHYQRTHENQYPSGFGVFLLERFIEHAIPIYVKKSEVQIVDKVRGAWANNNGQLVQFYTYECRMCDFESIWFDMILNHFTKAHPALKCCVLDVIRRIALSFPDGANEFSQCSLCGYIVLNASLDDMLSHCENKHDTSCQDNYTTHSVSERRYCQHCNFVGSIDSMQWHYAEAHDCYIFLWPNLKIDDLLLSKRELRCCICEFTSASDWDLAFHYQEKHLEKAATFKRNTNGQYQCVLCGIADKTLSGILEHHRYCTNSLIHTVSEDNHVRFLSCKHCKKVYTTSALLWRHITQHHCSFYQLFQADDLPLHTLKYGVWDPTLIPTENGTGEVVEFNNTPAVYSGSTSNPISLKILPQKGNNFSKMNGNSAIDEGLIKIPTFKCKFCQYSASHQGGLARHLRSVHSHDFTFRCFGCDKQFSILSDCMEHHSKIHGLEIGRETACNFLLSDVTSSQKEDGKYICMWCGLKGLSRFVLQNHITSSHAKVHGGRKNWKKNGPYSCRWCEYYTKNATSMRAHLLSKHQRSVSYHSLTNFRTLETDTAKSSESSDEEYVPSKRDTPMSSKSGKKTCFALTLRCSITEDSDCFHTDSLKSTHTRMKHAAKYPYTCRFCMRAYICATTFLKHCIEEHSQWCSVSTIQKRILMVPDPDEIPHVQQQLQQDWGDAEAGDASVFRDSDWPCDICACKYSTLVELQEHIQDIHSGRKLLLCTYCEFTSLTEKKIVAHSREHTLKSLENGKSRSSSFQGMDELPDFDDDDDIVDLVTMESNSTELNTRELERLDVDEPQTSNTRLVLSNKLNKATQRQDPPRHAKARKSIRGKERHGFLSNKPSPSKFEFESREKSPVGDITLCEKNVTIDNGLIRCSNCNFSCTDAQRMTTHFKSTHTEVKSYSCKFCDYVSSDFSSLDQHLAEFHKIAKNHQLGLQIHSGSYTEDKIEALSELRSRFMYTPTPCLPILREEVIYTRDEESMDITSPPSPVLQSSSVNNSDELKCSYCGFTADSTFRLEMHMRRHEGAFLEDPDGVSYKMTKINMMPHP